MQYLDAFYRTHDEQERFTPQSGQVEFLTTMRYIKKYLAPGSRILEIGAGSGRYSHALAREGFSVDAVELLDVNIEKIHETMTEGEPLRIFKGSALNLDFLEDSFYDIVLLLGPMYHLYEETDKKRALNEALRLTKRGGILMTAYCMADSAILMQAFIKNNAETLIENGLLNPVTFQTHSRPEDVFELYTIEDIDRLSETLPAKRMHLVSCDLSAMFLKNTIDNMDETAFDLYMRYHFTVCERPDLIGAGNHTLDILKKE